MRFIIGSIDREKILPYKIKENNIRTPNTVSIQFIYDISNNNLKNDIRGIFEKIKNEFSENISNIKFELFLSISKNLKMLFIDNFKSNFQFQYYFKTFRCSKPNSKICKLILNQWPTVVYFFKLKKCKLVNLVKQLK